MKRAMRCVWVLCALGAVSAFGGEPLIRLRRGVIEPDVAEPSRQTLAAEVLVGPILTTMEGQALYLVQLDRSAGAVERLLLEQAGGHVAGYVPEQAWVLLLRPDQAEAVRALPFVRWLGFYEAEMKRAPELDDLVQVAEVEISLTHARHVSVVRDRVEQAGGTVTASSSGSRWGTVRALLPADALAVLAARPEVEWIEPYVAPQLMNDVAVREEFMNVRPVWTNHGLTGSGQIVAVSDSGLDRGDPDTIHPDFSNRIHAAFGWVEDGNWADYNGHGTHVTGSVLGDGSAYEDGRFKGVAPSARLVFQAIGGVDGSSSVFPPSPVNLLMAQAHDHDARINTHSWGSSVAGSYTTMSREADEYLWEVDDILVLFSAGNSGQDSDSDGIIDPTSIGAPGTAKNVLTVGAAETGRPSGSGGYSSLKWGIGSWAPYYPVDPISNDLISTPADGENQGMAAFSSRGPTQDGRVKPDIVAPGTDIVSTRSRQPGAGALWGTGSGVLAGAPSAYYTFSGGTSMSTPLTAGAATLAREYLVDYVGITSPSAPLMKALLVNGAHSLAPGQYGTNEFQEIPSGPRPNQVEGWGHVNLAHSLFPSGGLTNLFWDRHTLTTDVTNRYPLIISGTNSLRVTLAWNDYPGSPMAEWQLVNDLDLRLIAPDGEVHYPHGADEPDRLNNLLGIDLDVALPGTNWVEVSGYHVPQGPQRYALMAKGEIQAPSQMQFYGTWTAPPRMLDYTEPEVYASLDPGSPGVAAVVAAYRVDSNAWQYAVMSLESSGGQTRIYKGVLPPAPAGSWVDWYVYAISFDLDTVFSETNRYGVASSLVRVSPGGAAEWPYNTWEGAFDRLEDALAYVTAGQSVEVDDGTYSGVTFEITQPISLYSRNGLDFTIIDGESTRTAMRIIADADVSGFSFINGFTGQDGGAIYMTQGSLSNSYVGDSSANRYGGGIFMEGGHVTHSQIEGNHANFYGGGVLILSGVLEHCVIHDNTAGGDAAGIEFWGGTVRHCTVAFNHADEHGGGLDVGGWGALYNNIVVSNTAGIAGGNWYKWVSEEIRYTLTSPDPGDAGSFDLDPLFFDAGDRDFRLRSEWGRYEEGGAWVQDAVTSPAIDMGDPASSFAHEPAPNGGRANLGAYGNTAFASMGPDDYRKLLIFSAHGEVSPTTGVYQAVTGETVNAGVLTTLITNDLEQYELSGWQLYGLTDENGDVMASTNVIAAALTNNAALTWTWHTNYFVAADAVGPGAVAFTNSWHRRGTNVLVTAVPDAYYGLDQWTGTVTSTQNPLSLLVNQPHQLTATFAPLLTAQGVPYYWLAGFGWTNDFEAVALDDADEDGVLTWEEYIAGTNPTNAISVLRVRVEPANEGYMLTWESQAGRNYQMMFTDALVGGETNLLFQFYSVFPFNMAVPLPDAEGATRYYWLGVTKP
jgi:hypothetical protein